MPAINGYHMIFYSLTPIMLAPFCFLLLSWLLAFPANLPRAGETAAAKGITATAPLSSSTPKEREITNYMCLCVSQ